MPLHRQPYPLRHAIGRPPFRNLDHDGRPSSEATCARPLQASALCAIAEAYLGIEDHQKAVGLPSRLRPAHFMQFALRRGFGICRRGIVPVPLSVLTQWGGRGGETLHVDPSRIFQAMGKRGTGHTIQSAAPDDPCRRHAEDCARA